MSIPGESARCGGANRKAGTCLETIGVSQTFKICGNIQRKSGIADQRAGRAAEVVAAATTATASGAKAQATIHGK